MSYFYANNFDIFGVVQQAHTLQAIWAFGLWKDWFVFGRFGKSEDKA